MKLEFLPLWDHRIQSHGVAQLGVRSVNSSMPTTYIICSTMTSDSFPFNESWSRTQLCIRSTGEAKNALTTSSQESETENMCVTLLWTPSRHFYPSCTNRHNTCKIAWSLCSQLIGKEGKDTTAHRQAMVYE